MMAIPDPNRRLNSMLKRIQSYLISRSLLLPNHHLYPSNSWSLLIIMNFFLSSTRKHQNTFLLRNLGTTPSTSRIHLLNKELGLINSLLKSKKNSTLGSMKILKGIHPSIEVSTDFSIHSCS